MRRAGSLCRIAATVALLVAAAGLRAAPALLHKPAPPISRPDLNGKPVDLRALRGKVVLVDFWATWCAPCLQEMPRLVGWQTRYAGQGFQIVGVSMDDEAAMARKAYARQKLNYPVVMGDAALGKLYGGVMGLPVLFLIDRRGLIQAQFSGETNPAVVETELKALLAGR